jgi:ribonuclease D
VPLLVDTPTRLNQLRQALQIAPRIAVDTESNSLFAYQERVCLIQLSTDEADYLVDPIRLGSAEMGLLGDLFADPAVEKVFHAAEYDVMTLRRDFGFHFANLFDTMIAARILGWEQVGLGAMLESGFGVRLDKRHQRANWGRRPLPPDLIRYAQFDTHYLLPLADRLKETLSQGGHEEEARELFDEVGQAEWSGAGFDPRGFWRINGARHLNPQEMAVLESVYLYRDQQARQRDLPVFKIISDQALVNLALSRPRTLAALLQVGGMSEGMIRQHGEGLLKAIEQGLQAPLPARPHQHSQPDEMAHRRFEALHAWRKERATRRGVSSEVVMSRDTLWELAERAPRSHAELGAIRGLGPWRIKTYGDELLEVLARAEQE